MVITALMLVVMMFPLTVQAAAVGRTYTLDADFDEGTLVNVNHDSPNNDQLQLNEAPEPFPFIAVACSGRGTIVRINTVTGEILGEYWSAPDGRGRNPSRTTVDLFGNVWAGNRAEDDGGKGSVIKIGVVVGGTRCDSSGNADPNGDYLKPPFDYNTCVDRNMDGLIKTSSGLGDIRPWDNAGGADDGGGVSTADDEAILMYVRVDGDQVRHVSVDANNNVWVGGYMDNTFNLLDGDNGNILATFDVELGGYGGLVDGNGVIWAASRNPLGLLRYDTKGTITTADDTWSSLEPLAPLDPPNSYGLGIDTNGNVWHAQFTYNEIYKYHPDGTVYAGFPKTTDGASGDRGVAVTPADNNVWVANSSGSDVSRLDNDGDLVKVITVGVMPTGVAVDAEGKVWVTNYSSNNVMRIDPNNGLGAVDLTVDLGTGANPYNYSDMTGIVAIQAARQGTWTVVHDSTELGTDWGTISWDSLEPDGTSVMVEARAADTVAGLAGETFAAVSNGAEFSGMAGQYIEILTTLSRGVGVEETPVLYELTVEPANQPPIAEAGPAQTVEQTSHEGAEVTLDGSGSSDPDGDPLDYVWTWDSESATGMGPIVIFPLGTTTVTLEVSDGEYTATDTVDITVEDTTPPELTCDEGANPHGNNIPGENRPDKAKGNNPDGFYQICVTDICDSAPVIYIGTEEFVVGQSNPDDFFIFEDGCVVVKFTEAPGATPSCKSIGSANGQAGAVSCHITLPSDPVITAIDASGNYSVCTDCLVPPPLK